MCEYYDHITCRCDVQSEKKAEILKKHTAELTVNKVLQPFFFMGFGFDSARKRK